MFAFWAAVAFLATSVLFSMLYSLCRHPRLKAWSANEVLPMLAAMLTCVGLAFTCAFVLAFLVDIPGQWAQLSAGPDLIALACIAGGLLLPRVLMAPALRAQARAKLPLPKAAVEQRPGAPRRAKRTRRAA